MLLETANGTLFGGAWQTGQIGGAIEFNADGNISVPSTAFDTVDQEASFAFWAYGGDTQPAIDNILYGSNAAGKRVFNIHLPYDNGNVYWDAGVDTEGKYDRILKNADSAVFKDSWHHWVFTKNASTGSMKIYLDGESWATGTGNTRSMAGVTSFTLGANTHGSSGYDGLIDDARIYDHELTSSEATALFVGSPINEITANSLAEMRAAGVSVDNSIVTLSTTGGDPHPVTGVVTPGHYWINGDHIVEEYQEEYDVTARKPDLLVLSGSGNTYDLAGTTINFDTRDTAGFGRSLAHGSGHTWWGYPIYDDIQLSGSEGGVRTYGGTNLTVDNVVVDGMRTGFATVATAGDVTITNSFAYNTTSGFDVGDNTTIADSDGNIVNGPLLFFYGSGNNVTIDLELTAGVPVGVNWSAHSSMEMPTFPSTAIWRPATCRKNPTFAWAKGTSRTGDVGKFALQLCRCVRCIQRSGQRYVELLCNAGQRPGAPGLVVF